MVSKRVIMGRKIFLLISTVKVKKPFPFDEAKGRAYTGERRIGWLSTCEISE
jgi:hypothetical protein